MKAPIITNNSGIYILEFYAKKKFKINVARYADIIFPKGYYYYSGSAQKNLRQRISRHIALEKTVHWHIDHLTTRKDILLKNIFIIEAGKKSLECEIVDRMSLEMGLAHLAKGFGSGDCDVCVSHLLFAPKKIDHNHLTSRYQSTVWRIPSSREISWR